MEMPKDFGRTSSLHISLEDVGFYFSLGGMGSGGTLDFSGSCLLLEIYRREEYMRGRIQKVKKVVL